MTQKRFLEQRRRLMRRLRRFKASHHRGSTIVAELLMILIVIIMSVTVFAFYSRVFGVLLNSTTFHTEEFTIVASGAPSGVVNITAVNPTPGEF
jgi:hypothetical protein